MSALLMEPKGSWVLKENRRAAKGSSLPFSGIWEDREPGVPEAPREFLAVNAVHRVALKLLCVLSTLKSH